LILSLAWLAAFIVLGALALRMYYLLTPTGPINGLYQSDAFSRPLYNAQFYGDRFYIERIESGRTDTLIQGSFRRVEGEDHVYLLEDELYGRDSLVVLGHKHFYFYDAETELAVRLELKHPLSPGTSQAQPS